MRFPTTLALSALAAAAHVEQTRADAAEAQQQPQRAASQSTVPGLATTLDSGELAARGISSVADIAFAMPGITVTPALNSSNTPILYMRGQGFDNPAQISRDGAVGVFQDGFYVSRPQQLLTLDMPDLERVEVLQGPAGALFGRNTTGGVLNLISKSPAGELRLTQSGEFGNRSQFRIAGSADTPRWHEVSAKFTLLASSIDGYVKNPLPGSHEYGEARQRAGRLDLRWDGLATVRAEYFLERRDLDSTPAYDTNPFLNGSAPFSFFFPYYANPKGPTTTAYRPVNLLLSTSNHVAQGLTLTWQPSSGFVVKSLTGYRTLSAHARQDYAEFLGFDEATDDGYRHHQYSQELQVTGELWGGQLTYRAAISYFNEGGLHDREFDVPNQAVTVDTQVSAATRSQATAAEAHWRPALAGRRFELTAAARYTKEVKDAERFVNESGTALESGAADGAISHLSSRRVDPALTASYQLTRAISVYATGSSAYRSGGALETAPIGEFATNTFRPESLRTWQLGMKSDFQGGRLRANLSAFTSRNQDIQIPLSLNAGQDEAYSLQSATIRGADLELAVVPFEDLALSARAAYLHWSIDRVDVLPGSVLDPASGSGSPYSVGDRVTSLFSLPYTPKYNATVTADYTLLRWYHSQFDAHLDYGYRGQFYSDAASGPAVPGRQFDVTPSIALLNARFVIAQEVDFKHHVTISLWGHNVLNRKYYQITAGYGAGVSQFQPDGTLVGWVARAGAWAAPASYGVSVSYEY